MIEFAIALAVISVPLVLGLVHMRRALQWRRIIEKSTSEPGVEEW